MLVIMYSKIEGRAIIVNAIVHFKPENRWLLVSLFTLKWGGRLLALPLLFNELEMESSAAYIKFTMQMEDAEKFFSECFNRKRINGSLGNEVCRKLTHT